MVKTLKLFPIRVSAALGVKDDLLRLRLRMNAIARPYKKVKVATWNTIPASIIRPPALVVDSVLAEAATPPPMACKTSEKKSQEMKIQGYRMAFMGENWGPMARTMCLSVR